MGKMLTKAQVVDHLAKKADLTKKQAAGILGRAEIAQPLDCGRRNLGKMLDGCHVLRVQVRAGHIKNSSRLSGHNNGGHNGPRILITQGRGEQFCQIPPGAGPPAGRSESIERWHKNGESRLQRLCEKAYLCNRKPDGVHIRMQGLGNGITGRIRGGKEFEAKVPAIGNQQSTRITHAPAQDLRGLFQDAVLRAARKQPWSAFRENIKFSCAFVSVSRRRIGFDRPRRLVL